jgi:glycerol-3-phosphate acyltransferase PlsY
MTLAIATLALANDWRQSALTTLAAVFVIIRHRANLVRLMNGTESRLSFSGKKPA